MAGKEEYKGEEDPNAQWAHAQSLEPLADYLGVKAELQYMKDLFYNYLPTLGSNMSTIDEHFAELEQAIEEGKPIIREEFQDDDNTSNTRGNPSSQDDDPNGREYRYFSASVFKEHASRSRTGSNRLGMVDSSAHASTDGSVQSGSTQSSPSSYISECEDFA